jgi:hypothetical protein
MKISHDRFHRDSTYYVTNDYVLAEILIYLSINVCLRKEGTQSNIEYSLFVFCKIMIGDCTSETLK